MLYDWTATSTALKTKVEIAVLPIGAIEQHSIHLPLGTDWLAAEAVGRRVAGILGQAHDVYLVPGWPYSLSQCHGPMPGTVWLTPHTLAAVLRDIVLSLYVHGIGRVAIVNGHGGNFVLDSEIRELNRLQNDLIVLNIAAWPRPEATGQTGRVTGGDIHAGAGETATQLYLNPSSVRAERIDHIPDVGREFLDYAYMSQISPMGLWGEPSLGLAEVGEHGLERNAEHMAQSAVEAFGRIAATRQQSRAPGASPT